MTQAKSPSKTAFFGLLTVLLCIAVAEGFAFISYRIVKDSVDLWDQWQDTARTKNYQRFLKRRYDPVTGWGNPKNTVIRRRNCLNEEYVRTFSGNGANVHSSDKSKPVRILVVGDSYAAGSDVNGDESFPAQLEQLLGIRLANHGVGGFGPVQALLHFRKVADFYDSIEIVIFSVMHENIRRMANSFRPVLVPDTGFPYGFKPFVRDGELHSNPNGPVPLPLPELEKRARQAFREDFWSRGGWSFPYALAWINFARTNYVELKIKSRWARNWGNDPTGYEAYYQSDKLRSEFNVVVEKLYAFAQSRNIRPIVVFIPKNPGDLTSPSGMVDDLRARYRQTEVDFVELGRMDIDWHAFNLLPGECHPSPYGHKMIAETIARYLDD